MGYCRLPQRRTIAQIRQAEAQMTKSRAQLANSRRDVERYQALLARDYASQQKADAVKTDSMALEATNRADEAVLDTGLSCVEGWIFWSSFCVISSCGGGGSTEASMICTGGLITSGVIKGSAFGPIAAGSAVASALSTILPAPRDADASMGICRLDWALSDWVRAVVCVFRANGTGDFAQA